MLQLILVILICIPPSHLIAFWAGNGKKIGFWWALFFCLTFSPVVGYILVLLSGKKEDKIKDSLARDYLLFMLSGISVPAASLLIVSGFNTQGATGVLCFFAGAGAMGVCLYCLKLAIMVPWDAK